MPRPGIAMRKIRDVLRLSRAEGLSPRQIAKSLSLPRITVRRYLERAALAEMPWPLPGEMDDQELEKRLYGPPVPLTKLRRLTRLDRTPWSSPPRRSRRMTGPELELTGGVAVSSPGRR